MIVEPLTLPPTARVSDALALMEHYHVSGVPITDEAGRLVGILTNRDLRFEKDVSQPVSAVMTSEGLVTASVGTTLEEAESLLHAHRIEKLPGRRRGRRAQGPDHGQGHPEADPVPVRDEGPAGPAARRRRGRRRPGRARARRGADRGGRRRARRRHGARPLARRDRDGRADQGPLRRVRGRRRATSRPPRRPRR